MTDRRAIEFNAAELASALTTCFEGYVMPFVLDAPGFDRRFRPEHLDTEASLLKYDGEAPAAICLIARRGWTCRCAAMAIAPEYRRQGLGLEVMKQVIEEAKARGDRRFVLEVIEQNPPAIELYKRAGLRIVRRLVGYSRPSQGDVPDPGLIEIDPLEVSRAMVGHFPLDVPWDYMPENLCGKAAPTRAWTLDGRAFALATDVSAERAVVWSLLTHTEHRGAGLGRRMVQAISGEFGGKALATPVAFPDDLNTGFFQKTGFVPAKISQYEMSIEDLSVP